MARQVTGRRDVLVVDGAYHGNTSVLTGLSPNRYKGPGGTGPDPTTHEVEQPNRYRGPHGYDDPRAGHAYAESVRRVVDRLTTPPAAFIAESVMGTAGSIFYPDGYLAEAFTAVRAAGGLCVADEVQVGFGRLGDVFWGFESQGVVPDIVTMGKPMGNGHPMAAVVTTREIADAFDAGMKYFNTFGGNPVSCAIGAAVLDEIEAEGLRRHAAETGRHFRHALDELAGRHELIGDVRGHGMYLGVELVRDRESKEPATEEALHVSELMKDEGVLVYPTGSANNVLKIKPPLTFTATDADLFTSVLDDVLRRDW
jgi:4-aminobutyrate aminotransferase-like enzyme